MEKKMKDTVKSAPGGLLEIVTADGWRALVAADEIKSIRGRREGGAVIHTRSGRRPILVDVPIADVLAIWRGAEHATT